MSWVVMDLFVNGIVIQKYVDSPYKGIDGSGFSANTGENWFLGGDDSAPEYFEEYYDEHIGRTFLNTEGHSFVAACTDMDYIYKYVEEAKKRNIRFRLLLCETDIPEPVFDDSVFNKKFLGYDYAYAAGDNYSAVYNEVPFVFPQFKLNSNGLFETKEEIDGYIAAREQFIKTHPPHTLEDGDFAVFRLSEIYL